MVPREVRLHRSGSRLPGHPGRPPQASRSASGRFKTSARRWHSPAAMYVRLACCCSPGFSRIALTHQWSSYDPDAMLATCLYDSMRGGHLRPDSATLSSIEARGSKYGIGTGGCPSRNERPSLLCAQVHPACFCLSCDTLILRRACCWAQRCAAPVGGSAHSRGAASAGNHSCPRWLEQPAGAGFVYGADIPRLGRQGRKVLSAPPPPLWFRIVPFGPDTGVDLLHRSNLLLATRVLD
jgi:hypothetical protein